MSEQSFELLLRIRQRLSRVSRRMTLADLLFGLILSAGVFSGVWVVSVAIEAGFWLDTALRTALFWTVLAVFAALFVYFLLMPLMRLSGVVSGPSAEFMARRIGQRFPQIGDRLIDLLDISEGRRTEAPEHLVDGAVRMLGREIEPVPFETVEDFGRARRALRVAAIPIASTLLFLAAAPNTFVDASKRILSPGAVFEQPAPFRLVVEPGSVELTRGSSLEIRVIPEGREWPRTVVLSVNNLDEDLVEDVRLTVDSAGVFRHQIANVRRSFRYRAEASPVASTWFVASVAEHPLLRNLAVTLDYPAYSGIPTQRLDPNVGDLSGLPGTRVSLELEIGGATPSEGHLLFDDGSTTELTVDGSQVSGSFTLTRAGTYRILVQNEQGVENQDPIAYTMDLVSDAPPSIVLLHPDSDAILREELRVGLLARLTDDFGFRDLHLHYRLAESRYGQPSESFSTIEIPLDDPRRLDQEIGFDWRIPQTTGLDPVPGDVIEYYLLVRDNDSYSGFKDARTPIHRLRLPSLAERYEHLHREQDMLESRMEEMIRRADQVGEQFRELRDEVRRKQDAEWEDRRQLEQIQERQRQLEEHVNELADDMRSVNESMRESDLLSPETLEMFREMQNVVEEINSPELMEALRQLQQALESLDLSQMQQAIQNFEFNEDQYRERLERALELFRNLRAQQGLEEAARRAEELARQQERLAELTQELMDRDTAADPTVPGDEAREDGREGGDEGDGGVEEGRAADEGEAGADEGHAGDDEGHAGDDGDAAGQDGDQEGGQTGEEGADSGGEQGESSPDGEQDPSGGTQGGDPSPGERPLDPDQVAREQERSREEMGQLEDMLQELQRQIEEMRRGPSEDMERLNQSLQQQQMQQRMQENADQLRENQLQDAQSGQQQMQQQLMQLQNDLDQMRQNMQGAQMEVNLAGLRRALSDVLTLSHSQEELRHSIRTNVSQAPSMREDARRQTELAEGLSSVIDSLQQLSRNVPQMSREFQRHAGQSLREMGQATEAMTERSSGQAANFQRGSMMHLNELALLLTSVMNQMMNADGSGGGASIEQMIDQLRQMSEQQQQLNEQIQQFLNDVQGDRLSVDQQERLRQMAAQQEAIREQLDQLRRNPEARGQLLGDLQRIAEQMEETIRELERRQVDQRTIERQQQILQRLLDAQRSIHQRGEEERREGTPGRDVLRDSPDELTPREAAEKLRRDLIRALEAGYAPDYEELIKRYFELLQDQTLEVE